MNDSDSGDDDIEPTDQLTRGSGSSAQTCSCCGVADDSAFEYYATKLRLEHESGLIEPEGDASVLNAELPDELRGALKQFLGGTTVETLGDWVTEVRRRAGGGPIEFGDLCHEDSETGHWGQVDGERYYFTCFFDAVVLAALTDRRVDVRTESPDGTVIEATAKGNGTLSVNPPETLVSFGVVTARGSAPEGDPTHEDVYESVCPAVQAFPTPQAYEQWAETVPATTIAMPLADATELATALTE